jgi:hypothetical protein
MGDKIILYAKCCGTVVGKNANNGAGREGRLLVFIVLSSKCSKWCKPFFRFRDGAKFVKKT